LKFDPLFADPQPPGLMMMLLHANASMGFSPLQPNILAQDVCRSGFIKTNSSSVLFS
jgi:hypothetical protein